MGRITGKSMIILRGAALTAMLTAGVACTPMTRYHGYTPSEDELTSIQVGAATRDSVIERFGPPTSSGLLQNNSMYYVSSEVRHFGALPPAEINRQVLAFRFDSGGIVRNIERYSLEDGRVVALDRRVTEDGINDVTFLGQLLGSLGRLDAGTLLGEEPSDL